jgi:hypothetical protein
LASNFGNTPVVEIPQNDNEAALAAHLQEIRESSQEYGKLLNEEAREKWEAIATANFQRQRAQADGIAERIAAEKQGQAAKDISEGDRLAVQMQALTDTFPPNWTSWTLPLDKLEQLSNLRQRVNRLAAATGQPGLADGVLESGGPLAPENILGLNPQQPQQQQQPKPATFPDGKTYQLKNLPNGDLEVQLITGERYAGDPITVTQRLAESQVNTKRWGQQQRLQAQQPQPMQPTAQPTEQTASGSLADDLAARQADALAKQFGFSDRTELMQWGETVNQKMATIQQFEREKQAMEFFTKVPDFPGTPEAISAVAQVVDSMGLPETAEAMQMAHAFAVSRGMYEPLSLQAQQAANGGTAQQITRQSPPPLLKTGNPEVSQGGETDPWKMPLADLRKMAIQQELEGRGPGYR